MQRILRCEKIKPASLIIFEKLLPFFFFFLLQIFFSSPSRSQLFHPFSFSFPPKTPSSPCYPFPPPKVSTCCAIHHLSRSGAPTTTMAPVTCCTTCLQQLTSRSWSPSPPLQEAVVHPGCSMRGLQYPIYIYKYKGLSSITFIHMEV